MAADALPDVGVRRWVVVSQAVVDICTPWCELAVVLCGAAVALDDAADTALEADLRRLL